MASKNRLTIDSNPTGKHKFKIKYTPKEPLVSLRSDDLTTLESANKHLQSSMLDDSSQGMQYNNAIDRLNPNRSSTEASRKEKKKGKYAISPAMWEPDLARNFLDGSVQDENMSMLSDKYNQLYHKASVHERVTNNKRLGICSFTR
jgi:hypothetical protein